MAGVKKMNVEELVVIGSDDGQRGYHIHAEDIKKISTTGLRRKIDKSNLP
jgi:hypothetical protein